MLKFYLSFITTVRQTKDIDVSILLPQFMKIVHIEIITDIGKLNPTDEKRNTTTIRMVINTIIMMDIKSIRILIWIGIITTRTGVSVQRMTNYQKNVIVKNKLIWRKRDERNIWRTYAVYFHVAVAVIVGAKNFPRKKI